MLCVIVQSHNKDSFTARVLNLIPALLFLLGINALSFVGFEEILEFLYPAPPWQNKRACSAHSLIAAFTPFRMTRAGANADTALLHPHAPNAFAGYIFVTRK
jgi:hypothetical protein